MASIYLLMASAALFGMVTAQNPEPDTDTAAPAKEKEFPLFWVCLGITAVGIVIALYVAYRRPDEFHLPDSTMVATTEPENGNDGNEPTTKRRTLNDDLEAV